MIQPAGPGYRRLALPLPFALRSVNAYLVEGDGTAIVDCGLHTESAERALIDGLAEAGLAPKDVRDVFVTHLHPDHIGMAGWLEKAGDRIRSTRQGLVPFLCMLGLLVGLVLLEKDLGTSMVLGLIAISMFVVAGARWTHVMAVLGLSAAAMVLLIFGPQLGDWLAALVGLGKVFELLWNILRWPVSAGMLIVAMAVVYYYAPDVEQQWKWITPGAVFAVLATIVASLGFSVYVSQFGSYNKTYGSIGAVIVFLTWLYLTGLCLLIGGEINAEVEHAAPAGKAPGQKTSA